jgi:AAA domain
MMLEDDAGEYQEKFKSVVGDSDTGGRIRIITRDDFNEAKVIIDAKDDFFKKAVRTWAEDHKPDLVVIDNLAHVINADYGDSKRVHELMQFCYELARESNAAVIIAAHPRKDDNDKPASLEQSTYRFFEEIMGTSHFINSTGSIWCLERPERKDHSVFLGGRQRGDGQQQLCFLSMTDSGHFELVSSAEANLPLVLNTDQRRDAWKSLPDPPGLLVIRRGNNWSKLPFIHRLLTKAG